MGVRQPVINEYDVVALTHPMPAHGLVLGAQGTVVCVYAADAFEVEFMNLAGETIALLTLNKADIELVWIAPRTAS